MFKHLIEYISGSSPEVMEQTSLEDMAVLLALYESYEESSDRSDLAFVPQALEKWTAVARQRAAADDPERGRPLLRRLLGRLVTMGPINLNRSELDVLSAVLTLLQRLERSACYEDTWDELYPRTKGVEMRRSFLPSEEGLMGLQGKIFYVTPKVLQAAKLQSVNTFSGIEMPLRGPLYMHHGDLKILGSVPDECIVVVDGGSCFVNGYVEGRIAATEDCAVRENISGVVVTSRGSVRCQRVLSRALVVSKWGSVEAQQTEDPQLVFAGERIAVHGDARLGVYASPVVEVAGQVLGGDYSFSKTMTADLIAPLESRNLVIKMPRRITCESYGGLVERGATRLLGKMHKLRQRIQNYGRLITAATEECEHFANSATIYLVGGDAERARLDQLGRLQRRLSCLDRVIAGIDTLSEAAEHQAELRARAKSRSEELTQEAGGGSSVDDTRQDLEQLTQEEEVDADVEQESTDLGQLSEKMHSLGKTQTTYVLDLRDRRVDWFKEREDVQKKIASIESAIRLSTHKADELGRLMSSSSKLEVLSQLLPSLMKRADGDEMGRRANSRFIALILKKIEGRKKRLHTFSLSLEHLETEHGAIGKELMETYGLVPPTLETDNNQPPRVTGRFRNGVTLCTDAYLLEETEVRGTSVLCTASSGDAVKTYQRDDTDIVEFSGAEELALGGSG